MMKMAFRVVILAIIVAIIWPQAAIAQDTPTLLEEVDGSPVLVGDLAEKVVITPNGEYVYVVSEESIAAFYFEDGELREVDGSPFYVAGSHFQPVDIAVSPNGKYLYVAHRGFVGRSLLSPITAYLIQPGTGTLIELRNSPFTTYASSGRGLARIVMTPNGRYVYALNTDDKSITVFEVNGNTGNLYENGSIEVGGSMYAPTDLAVSPDSAYLYVSNQGFIDDGESMPLSIYRINSRNGNLREVYESPYPIPADGAIGFSTLTVHPDGSHLILLNSSARTLTAVSMQTRSRPAGFSTLNISGVDYEPYGLSLSPDGSHIYISNRGFIARSLLSPITIVEFDADAEHILTVVGRTDVVSQEEGLGELIVSPDGDYLLQTNPAVGALHVFEVIN